jgi:hypothetical protein
MRICDDSWAKPSPINQPSACDGIGSQSTTAIGTERTVDSRK